MAKSKDSKNKFIKRRSIAALKNLDYLERLPHDMRYFFVFYLYSVSKGYWIKQVSIESTDLFIEYIQTVIPWLLSVGGIVIAKDISQKSDLNEWDGGQLGVVVEFESKSAAKKAFESNVFQEYIDLRGLDEDLTLSIWG